MLYLSYSKKNENISKTAWQRTSRNHIFNFLHVQCQKGKKTRCGVEILHQSLHIRFFDIYSGTVLSIHILSAYCFHNKSSIPFNFQYPLTCSWDPADLRRSFRCSRQWGFPVGRRGSCGWSRKSLCTNCRAKNRIRRTFSYQTRRLNVSRLAN